jgi:hypothetical protein
VKKLGPNALSEIVPGDAGASASVFAEDFSLEHSSPDASAISISISACTDSVVVPAAARNPQASSAISHPYPKAS